MANITQILPDLEGDEFLFVQGLIKEMDDDKAQMFANVYRSRRKDPTTLLLVSLIGFIGIAGIQRFMVGQTGMGLLFLFTGGLCGIGTIVDIVTAKKIAFTHNQTQAQQTSVMIKDS